MRMPDFNKRLLNRSGEFGLVTQIQAANHACDAQVIVTTGFKPDMLARKQVILWLNGVPFPFEPTEAQHLIQRRVMLEPSKMDLDGTIVGSIFDLRLLTVDFYPVSRKLIPNLQNF